MVKRQRKGSRRAYPMTLILCQGEVTEPEYFRDMQRRWRSKGFTVRPCPESPRKMVDKAGVTARRDDYDVVWIVLDKDNSSDDELISAATRCAEMSGVGKGKRRFHLVVTNVCFEAWLVAHVRKVPATMDSPSALQKEALSHHLVEGKKAKNIHPDFPYDRWEHAVENIEEVAVGEVGRHPSTSVPALLRAMEAARGSQPG
ncbi:RloB family protein [Corynebacterium bovis]|uniref:RloB family protein n=1 Tax=Corynebacterium bovis TaxID=36808 RepID=UPI0031395758